MSYIEYDSSGKSHSSLYVGADILNLFVVISKFYVLPCVLDALINQRNILIRIIKTSLSVKQ